jgi:hypothetical protein
MPATAISPADFEVMLSLARAIRVHVDALPHGIEVVESIRTEVEPTTELSALHPRHDKLVAAVLELLRTPGLSNEQSAALRASFFGVE